MKRKGKKLLKRLKPSGVDFIDFLKAFLPLTTQAEIKVCKLKAYGKSWWALLIRDITEENGSDLPKEG